VYDRYVHLSAALKRYPDLETILLSPDAFRTPVDRAEYNSLVVDDPYNLQLFSQLFRVMGYDFPAQDLPAAGPETKRNGMKRRIRQTQLRLTNQALHLCAKLLRSKSDETCQIALDEMYCSFRTQWTLVKRSRFRAFPLKLSAAGLADQTATFDQRRMGLATLSSSSEFERLFVQLLPQNFPSSHLESYQTGRAMALEQCSRPPAVIVSVTGWYANEALKFVAAEAAENGTRLVAVQHGGGYGTFRYHAPELFESRFSDLFGVWGWAASEAPKQRNLPSLKMEPLARRLPKPSSGSKHEHVLFIAGVDPRYLHRFSSMPLGGQWLDFFDWELRFFGTVPEPLRRKILYRPRIDYGYAVRERISGRFPEVQWDLSRSFYRRLLSSRLVIIDNLSTTLLEALTANVPTVLFYDPSRWEVREAAQPYIDQLRSVGIFWDSPEAAAEKLTAVYDDPWRWWNSDEVQTARRDFVDRFALAKADWAEAWLEMFDEELRHSLGATKQRESLSHVLGNAEENDPLLYGKP
jgi:putative transferase (TIGR04331 family)